MKVCNYGAFSNCLYYCKLKNILPQCFSNFRKPYILLIITKIYYQIISINNIKQIVTFGFLFYAYNLIYFFILFNNIFNSESKFFNDFITSSGFSKTINRHDSSIVTN